MEQFLYKIQPTRSTMLTDGPTDYEAKTVSQHFGYLQQLTKDGIVFLAGRTLNTDPSSFGIVIFQAESEEQAQAIVENDPAVKNQVMSATLFPYRIALADVPQIAG